MTGLFDERDWEIAKQQQKEMKARQAIEEVEDEERRAAVERMRTTHTTPLLDKLEEVWGKNGGWQEDYDWLKDESYGRFLSPEERARLAMRKEQLGR